jgi:hypothetical protein
VISRKVFVLDDEWKDLRPHFQRIQRAVSTAAQTDVEFVGHTFDPAQPMQAQIREATEHILGTESGDIGVSAVLLDLMQAIPLG